MSGLTAKQREVLLEIEAAQAAGRNLTRLDINARIRGALIDAGLIVPGGSMTDPNMLMLTADGRERAGAVRAFRKTPDPWPQAVDLDLTDEETIPLDEVLDKFAAERAKFEAEEKARFEAARALPEDPPARPKLTRKQADALLAIDDADRGGAALRESNGNSDTTVYWQHVHGLTAVGLATRHVNWTGGPIMLQLTAAGHVEACELRNERGVAAPSSNTMCPACHGYYVVAEDDDTPGRTLCACQDCGQQWSTDIPLLFDDEITCPECSFSECFAEHDDRRRVTKFECNACGHNWNTPDELVDVDEPTIDDIRHAATQGKDPFSMDGEPTPILGVDTPTQEQTAEQETAIARAGVPASEVLAQGLTFGQFVHAQRLTAQKRTIVQVAREVGITAAQVAFTRRYPYRGDTTPAVDGLNVPHVPDTAANVPQSPVEATGRAGITHVEVETVGLTLAAYSYMARLMVHDQADDATVTARLKEATTKVPAEQLAFVRARTNTQPPEPEKAETPMTVTDRIPGIDAPTTYQLIPIADLHPDPGNIRHNVNGDELVPSLKAGGVETPLLVYPRPEGGFFIADGNRRYYGSKKAGLAELPCMVRARTAAEVKLTMVVTALQREGLSPIEEAEAFRSLIDELGIKQADVAKKVGASASVVSRRLALLELPETARDMVHAGTLTVELAELYKRLPADKIEKAARCLWTESEVTKVIKKYEREAKTAELEKLIADAGAALIPAGKINKWLPGSDTHKYSWPDGAWNPDSGAAIDPTPLAIQTAIADKNVVGLAIADVWNGEYVEAIVPVHSKRAPKAEIDAKKSKVPGSKQAVAAAKAVAERERRNAERVRFSEWVNGLGGRKWKAADLMPACLLVLVAQSTWDAASHCKTFDLTVSSGRSTVALAEFASTAKGEDLQRLVVELVCTIMADTDHDPEEIGPLAEMLGWQPTPP